MIEKPLSLHSRTEDDGPFWSVMIPAYNPRPEYLTQTLRSILEQDPGPELMQIEVIDDCSSGHFPSRLIEELGNGRVSIVQERNNVGLAKSWNRCIERAKGEWVHILHQDDFVLPGFYEKVAQTAKRLRDVSLIATRSFLTDAEGVIVAVSDRLPTLEGGSRAARDFYYFTPIQCPGVVVKRAFYAQHGGFRSDLTFTLDREMWARAITRAGGAIMPDVLSCYRMSRGNESDRLYRTADGLRDLDRCNRLFAEHYPDFDYAKASRIVYDLALLKAVEFEEGGDIQAAETNWTYWRQNAPIKLRIERFMKSLAKILFR